MENTRDKYKALFASLGVHLILFFLAAAFGLFSMAAMKQANDPVEVVIYDEAQDEGSEGGGSPPQVEATPAVDEVVIPDKTLPPLEEKPPESQEKESRKREAQAGNPWDRVAKERASAWESAMPQGLAPVGTARA